MPLIVIIFYSIFTIFCYVVQLYNAIGQQIICSFANRSNPIDRQNSKLYKRNQYVQTTKVWINFIIDGVKYSRRQIPATRRMTRTNISNSKSSLRYQNTNRDISKGRMKKETFPLRAIDVSIQWACGKVFLPFKRIQAHLLKIYKLKIEPEMK